jgi:hypothetical protein
MEQGPRGLQGPIQAHGGGNSDAARAAALLPHRGLGSGIGTGPSLQGSSSPGGGGRGNNFGCSCLLTTHRDTSPPMRCTLAYEFKVYTGI